MYYNYHLSNILSPKVILLQKRGITKYDAWHPKNLGDRNAFDNQLYMYLSVIILCIWADGPELHYNKLRNLET
jgi:hypothetical protein